MTLRLVEHFLHGLLSPYEESEQRGYRLATVMVLFLSFYPCSKRHWSVEQGCTHIGWVGKAKESQQPGEPPALTEESVPQ